MSSCVSRARGPRKQAGDGFQRGVFGPRCPACHCLTALQCQVGVAAGASLRATSNGAQWPQGGRGVGVGEVAALVDLARFLEARGELGTCANQASGWTVAPFPLRLFL